MRTNIKIIITYLLSVIGIFLISPYYVVFETILMCDDGNMCGTPPIVFEFGPIQGVVGVIALIVGLIIIQYKKSKVGKKE